MRFSSHARMLELAFALLFLASVSATAAPAAGADFVPTVPWSAQFTQNLHYFTSDDAVPDETRPFVGSWEFLLVKFLMPGSITATTPLDTTGWVVSPAITPTRSADGTTYRWEDQSGFFMSSFLAANGRPGMVPVSSPSSLGASLVRESVGGTRIDASATVTRSYVITATGTTDLAADISVFLTSGSPGSPNPVLVGNQQCEGARVLGGLPGGFAWAVNLPQGIAVQFRCSATLTNTAPTAAHYMPVVSATSTEQTAQGPETGRTQYSFDATELGRVAFEVVPGTDRIAQGRLTRIANRTVFMNPRNQALVETQFTYLGATSGYAGESVTLSARLNHHGTFPVISRPVRFDIDGASYTATTGADGIASVTIPAGLGAAGPHALTISSQEDGFFLGTSLTTTFMVLPRLTRITYTGDTTALYGEARLGASLVDERTATPLAGQLIVFSVDNNVVGAAATDATGSAELTTASPDALPAGTHDLAVFYAGDATHASSASGGHITILGRPTELTYTGDILATFGFATLAGRLEDERTGAALSGKTLSFTVDGSAAGSAATGTTGTATIPLSGLMPGSHEITVTFEGDTSHAASSARGRIVIANSVGKVTGDVRTANGVRAIFSARADGSTISGTIQLVTATQTLNASISAVGLSTDQRMAMIYGETGSGDRIVAELTDLGEPGRSDRAIVRLNGEAVTGDGMLSEGNVQIHK